MAVPPPPTPKDTEPCIGLKSVLTTLTIAETRHLAAVQGIAAQCTCITTDPTYHKFTYSLVCCNLGYQCYFQTMVFQLYVSSSLNCCFNQFCFCHKATALLLAFVQFTLKSLLLTLKGLLLTLKGLLLTLKGSLVDTEGRLVDTERSLVEGPSNCFLLFLVASPLCC